MRKSEREMKEEERICYRGFAFVGLRVSCKWLVSVFGWPSLRRSPDNKIRTILTIFYLSWRNIRRNSVQKSRETERREARSHTEKRKILVWVYFINSTVKYLREVFFYSTTSCSALPCDFLFRENILKERSKKTRLGLLDRRASGGKNKKRLGSF